VNSVSEADEIRRQMAYVRSELHRDAEGLAANARVMADWRYYVRRYPWVSMAAAAAVGYLVVPHKPSVLRPDVDTLVRMAKNNGLLLKPQKEPEGRGGWAGSLLGLLASVAMRQAMAHFGDNLKGSLFQRPGTKQETAA